MSAIARQVAAEHFMTSSSGCTCGGLALGGSYPQHVAEVTEQAVRYRIALELDREALNTAWTARAFALQHASKIARGERP